MERTKYGRMATGRLLQRAIDEASETSFTTLKTVIWTTGTSPLDELCASVGSPRGAHRGEHGRANCAVALRAIR